MWLWRRISSGQVFVASSVGETVSFIDNSTATENIESYKWEFEGQADTIPNVLTAFSGYGEKEVQLVVETVSGCIDTVIKSVMIFPKPFADFVFVSDCSSDEVVFTRNSNIPLGTISNLRK